MMDMQYLNTDARIVVDTKDIDIVEWLNYRRTGIGGSDVGAIFGISPFKTGRDIYKDKITVVESVERYRDNWIALEYGHRLESLVAEIFAYKTGYRVFKDTRMFRHPDYDFMIVDVDFFVELPSGEICCLECKTTTAHNAKVWAQGKIPLGYELQVRHTQAILNMQKGFIACLWDNNEKSYTHQLIERDLSKEFLIISKERQFWTGYVKKRVPPPIIEYGDLALKSVRQYYEKEILHKGAIGIDPAKVVDLEKYLALKEEKARLTKKASELDAKMKNISANVIDAIKNSPEGRCHTGNTDYFIKNETTTSDTIYKEDLMRLKEKYPAVYEEFAKKSERNNFAIEKEEF